jgi:hypothetical protein
MEKKDIYNGAPKVVKIMAEKEQTISPKSSPENGLQDFKNINNSLMQDALNVWAELWAELDSSRRKPSPEGDGQAGGPGNMVKPETDDGFEPSCGWSKFLEKMWVLWYYLDFAKRISQQ